MRIFILALLALNVIYFFFPVSGQDSLGSLPQGERGIPLLVLLDEKPLATRVAASGLEASGHSSGVPLGARGEVTPSLDSVSRKTQPPAEGASLVECLTIGPFRKEEAAELATQELLKQGVKVNWRAAKERRTKGYSVYLPPYPSHEAARQVVDRLRAHGVTDYYIYSDATKENSISLGFFTLKAGSEKRVYELKVMGYSPRVEARFDEIPVYWLDYQVERLDPSKDVWDGYLLPAAVDVLRRDCK